MTVTKDVFGCANVCVCVCACVRSMTTHTSGCSFACRHRGRSSAKTQRLVFCTFKWQWRCIYIYTVHIYEGHCV